MSIQQFTIRGTNVDEDLTITSDYHAIIQHNLIHNDDEEIDFNKVINMMNVCFK